MLENAVIKIQKIYKKNKSLKNPKFITGKEARKKWRVRKNLSLEIEKFNAFCNISFEKVGRIELDPNPKKQITLKVLVLNRELWNLKKEFVYIFTINNLIAKIGGTRSGIKDRWTSYLCGFCVPERKNKKGKNYPGKMSITNARIYHTIENDLIENQNNIWEIYVWVLPECKNNINILGENVEIFMQTFHAYEAICIKKFKELNGILPFLNKNCDPNY